MTTLETTKTITALDQEKEQIKNIRSAWKAFHADGKHKKYNYENTYDGSIHKKSDLTVHHHLLYAALCGRDFTKGFTALTERKRNGQDAYWAFHRTVKEIKSAYSLCGEFEKGNINETDWRYKSYLRAKARLFLPFGETVSLGDLSVIMRRLEQTKM